MGSESLALHRQGMDTVGHNIANSQTEGFSRQRVDLKTKIPMDNNRVVIGNGVTSDGISRAHDKYIDKQLNESQQILGESSTRSDQLKRLEILYNTESETNLSDKLSDFFNSLNDLAAHPDDIAVRTNVKENAANLITAARSTDQMLKKDQIDIDTQIKGEADSINQLLEKLSDLNVKISNSDGKANDFLDQRDLLLKKLGEKIEISYYTTDSNLICVRGPKETLLLDGKDHAKLELKKNEKGLSELYIGTVDGKMQKNVSDSIKRGNLSGLFYVRDNVISNLLDKNNELVFNFANSFNEIHRQGYGIGNFNNVTGRDFFKVSIDKNVAAETFDMTDTVISDINAISAAASPNASGDNVIVNRLIHLKDENIFDDGTMNVQDFYGDFVSKLAAETQRAHKKQEADDLITKELNSRRESIAGVSLDEEAVNMMKWQTAFEASSKVIHTIDEMLDTVLNLR